MRNHTRKLMAVLFIALLLLFTTWTIKASGSGGQYAINWHSMDSGGTLAATGGTFELMGTIGQVDTAVIAQDTYEIQAGFWSATATNTGPHQIYLPSIQKP